MPPRSSRRCNKCIKNQKGCKRHPSDTIQRCARCERLDATCSLSPVTSRGVTGSNTNLDTSGPPLYSLSSPTQVANEPEIAERRSSNWGLGGGFDFGHASYWEAVNTQTQRIFARVRSDLENSMDFEGIDFNSTILTRPLPSHSRRMSKENYDRVSRQIEHLHHHQLYGVHGRHTKCTAYLDTSSAEMMQSIDPTSGDFKVVLCGANVPKPCRLIGLHDQHHARNSVNELPASFYLSTEAAFRDLMVSISREPSGNWSKPHYAQYNSSVYDHGPFPASHIAYWNLDRETAYLLWQNRTVGSPVRDVLGRTFPHIVAEAGDSELLSRMSTQILKNVGYDGRCLSLLDLAIIGESSCSVKRIIDDGIVPPPFTQAMQRAICGGRLAIAELLLPYLRFAVHHDGLELHILANLAGDSSFTELQGELNMTSLIELDPSEVISAIDALGPYLSSESTIIPGNAVFDLSYHFDGTQISSSSVTSGMFPDMAFPASRSMESDLDGGSLHGLCTQPFSPS